MPPATSKQRIAPQKLPDDILLSTVFGSHNPTPLYRYRYRVYYRPKVHSRKKFIRESEQETPTPRITDWDPSKCPRPWGECALRQEDVHGDQRLHYAPTGKGWTQGNPSQLCGVCAVEEKIGSSSSCLHGWVLLEEENTMGTGMRVARDPGIVCTAVEPIRCVRALQSLRNRPTSGDARVACNPS